MPLWGRRGVAHAFQHRGWAAAAAGMCSHRLRRLLLLHLSGRCPPRIRAWGGACSLHAAYQFSSGRARQSTGRSIVSYMSHFELDPPPAAPNACIACPAPSPLHTVAPHAPALVTSWSGQLCLNAVSGIGFSFAFWIAVALFAMPHLRSVPCPVIAWQSPNSPQ
jgi:hypothetical protein